jgi:putative iron-regulated protein
VVSLAVAISACQINPAKMNDQAVSSSVLETYANMALDGYNAALTDARSLQSAINQLAAAPSSADLQKARNAWLQSRESYGLTEIFRLSNGPIDGEEGWVADAYGALEGQINAWPLDENMIDYTVDASGKRTSGNIIVTAGVFNPGGEDAKAVDVSTITAEAISELNENGGEANVASGYHAIEFLLWGQDQDYSNFAADTITHGALVAGQRPLSDFTSDTYAPRRLQYLQAAADKLVQDLKIVAGAWSKSVSGDCDADATGCYRAALLGQLQGKDAAKNIGEATALTQIVAGMGVFIKSELANERIAVAVLTPSEEDEHSCFSDNTHRDITLNYQGFVNVLKGSQNGKDYGVSLYSRSSAETRAGIDALIAAVDSRVYDMNQLAKNKWHFDYQILPGNNAREIRRMKNDMRKLGDMMVSVAKDLNISMTTDDVTDPEETKI